MSCEGCPSQGNCGKDASSCGVLENKHANIKNVITVMSGKGGVGKSTVTVMLAKSLALLGYKVGIMDADITGPSIPRLMHVENAQCFATAEDRILPVESEGIKTMSLNYILKNETDPVIWRGAIISNVVKQFYSDVVWGELDFLLIDMPPGTGDVALTIMQSLPVTGVVMVSTPQPMVSMIVEKAIHMCEQMQIPVLGIVENMAYLECPNCSEKINFYNMEELDAFIQRSGTKLYATLPMLDLIRDINTYMDYNEIQKSIVDQYLLEVAKQLAKDVA
ncbi:MAG: Mrp/NBP35 family ATP-binding protein [Bacillota bacterium]|nr:Mrp/NBP35 family ATP-binding protein [Bacillota bacterium]